MSNVLVISVHPDDETLGCGGTILKHSDQKDNVTCVFVTSGNSRQKSLIDRISNEYRFNYVETLGLEELTLDDISLNEIIPLLSDIFFKYEPETIYIPNRSDIHSDHRRCFDAVMSCTKTFRYPFIKRILMCEVISETDFAPALCESVFVPNVFVDISKYWTRKMQILMCYESELLDAPHTRSLDAIEAMHRYRGSQISCRYAESFMLIKEIS